MLDEPAFFPAQIGLGESLLFGHRFDMLESHAANLRRFGQRGEEEAEILLIRDKLERNQFADARNLVVKTLQRFPSSIPLRLLHTRVLLNEGADDGAAEHALQQVLELAPGHPEATNNLAALRAKRTRVSSGSSAPSRILLLCPDNDSPSGGVRRLYRHADVLRAHGHAAAMVHERPGFRCTWFANDTPVIAMSEADLTTNDYLMIPDIFVALLPNLAPGVPKVIFNQNAYLTFSGWPVEGWDGKPPYRHPDVIATFAVSDDNIEYLRYSFPELPVHRIHYGIDPLFAPRWPKRRELAYMPRKNAQDVVQVLNILRCRGALNGWELTAIDALPEHEVAERLRSCAAFFSFGNPEGCPLPPLEAMASGCVVVGYHGRGGREYFDQAFSYPVEAGDIVGFARAVEEMLAREQAGPGTMERQAKQAMEFVRGKYPPEQEAKDIMEIWRTILHSRMERAASPATA